MNQAKAVDAGIQEWNREMGKRQSVKDGVLVALRGLVPRLTGVHLAPDDEVPSIVWVNDLVMECVASVVTPTGPIMVGVDASSSYFFCYEGRSFQPEDRWCVVNKRDPSIGAVQETLLAVLLSPGRV